MRGSLPQAKIIAAIRSQLGPHLLVGKYTKLRPKDAPASWGMCYVASECLYHLWGKANGYTPMCVPYRMESDGMGTHWFLEHRPSGLQLDITSDQFTNTKPDYKAAKPNGFMTKKPSKRAQQIIDAVLRLQA